MNDLPIMLHVRGRRCVIVGGGSVAVRRAAALRQAGAAVTVIAPQTTIEPAEGVEVVRRAYEPGDLADALLVVIATDDAAVNAAVAADAAKLGVLTNRADAPAESDLTVPAHAHHGPVTIAVTTSGISAAAAAAIRRELSEALNEDWPRLLTIIAPYRAQLQHDVTDKAAREDALRQLADEQAMTLLRTRGPEALKARCGEIVDVVNQSSNKPTTEHAACD